MRLGAHHQHLGLQELWGDRISVAPGVSGAIWELLQVTVNVGRPGLVVQRCLSVFWGETVEESKFNSFLVATVAITLPAGASG